MPIHAKCSEGFRRKLIRAPGLNFASTCFWEILAGSALASSGATWQATQWSFSYRDLPASTSSAVEAGAVEGGLGALREPRNAAMASE